MRIAVSGSFSTGKTTLIKDFVSCTQNQDFKVIEEVARTVIASGLELDKKATIDSYLFYINLQLTNERKYSKYKNVISDRILIDLLSYIRVNKDKSISIYLEHLLKEIIEIEKKYYDIFIYLPVEFEPVADGIRETNIVYQNIVNSELLNIYKEFGLQYHEIRGSQQNRLIEMNNLINASR